MSGHKRIEGWQATGVGLAATAAVALAYAFGGLDWLERKTLDLRFLYASSVPESHRLVCIDIDDAALELAGRWPWHRDVQAAVLGVLAEAGVDALLIDLTLVEPEPYRTIVPRRVDITRNTLDLVLSGEAATQAALPDLELCRTIEAIGAVFLATDYATGGNWQDFLASDDFAAILAPLAQGDVLAAQRSAAAVPPRATRDVVDWSPLLWAQVVEALTHDPTQDAAAVAAALPGVEVRDVAPVLSACREVALRRATHAWLDADPQRWSLPHYEIYARLYDALIGGEVRFAEPLGLALAQVLGYAATVAPPFVPLERVAAIAQPVDRVSPVYFLHARAARRCGFVVFEPDSDGVTRRMRLLVQHRGHVIPQLAFAVACDALDLRVAGAAPGQLVLARPDNTRIEIQLDADGRVVVPWVPQADWTRQFGDHVPIGVAWQVHERRLSLANNEQLLLDALRSLPADVQPENLAQFCEDLEQRLLLDARLRLARYRNTEDDVARFEDFIRQYEAVLGEEERTLRAAIDAQLAAIGAPTSQAAEGAAARGAQLQHVQRVFAANDEHRAEIATTLKWLRQRVQGKIGLVGYTATALADMTPIPTHPRAPGVIAHANLLNGLLTGQTVTWAPAWFNIGMAALLGVLSTAVSVRWGPRTAALVGALALGYVGVAGGLAFYVSTYWIALTPAVGTLVASYVAVLAYRYLFLERERRQLATSLGQYTSATLARKMAEDPELCKRAETRDVTAVFTDLAGFTTISEQIGAERTQHVLNISLGRFSDVMLEYEGMINKFIGDGIFAFWNPVIYPQPDHARRACETAIDLHVALARLIEEQVAANGDEAFRDLRLRVGVATGSAVVGPCGSDKKYDYTCIGDSVNVAARLESANKFYGTRVLISGATLDAAGEGFAVRPLGSVQVKGKTRGVPIFELLGRMTDVKPEQLRCAEAFGEAVVAFQRRDWDAAERGFTACLDRRADDLAARRYLEALRAYRESPPGEEWSGALELAEK